MAFVLVSGHMGGYLGEVKLLIDIRIRTGQYAQARQLAVDSVKQARAVGADYVGANAEMALGELDLLAGDLDTALAHLRCAAAEFDRIDARHAYAKALFGIGRALAVQGAIPAACGFLQDALGIFRALGSLGVPDEVEAVLNELNR